MGENKEMEDLFFSLVGETANEKDRPGLLFSQMPLLDISDKKCKDVGLP